MYVEDITEVYDDEHLKYNVEEENQSVFFKMDTKVSPDVLFRARIVNPTSMLFSTLLPVRIPEKKRADVAQYLNSANCGLLLGNFEMNPANGQLSYRVTGCFEDGEVLADTVIRRMTYIGFNMFDKFVPGVFAIVYGGKTAAEAYAEIKAAEQAAQLK